MKLKWNNKGILYDPEMGDFYYDLTDGGYCKPENYCVNKSDIVKILDAIEVLKDYEESLQELADTYEEDYLEEEE